MSFQLKQLENLNLLLLSNSTALVFTSKHYTITLNMKQNTIFRKIFEAKKPYNLAETNMFVHWPPFALKINLPFIEFTFEKILSYNNIKNKKTQKYFIKYRVTLYNTNNF